MTERLRPTDTGLARAVELLHAGETVAFPTETVYGLGADATNGRAVASIFQAKGRPSFNPLIVHVPNQADAERLIEMPDNARKLAVAFWPGPLTLVAPIRPKSGIADLVMAGLPTLAVRVPEHPLARRLLTATARPVAAPSANPSGQVSPTTAAHVLAGLEGRIGAVLDDGPCSVGLESTIIGIDGEEAVLLRPGGLPIEGAEKVLGRPLRLHDGSIISAPGQLTSHYAPNASIRLDAVDARDGEIWLGFGAIGPRDVSLSSSGDLREAAATLFAWLRDLDANRGSSHTIAIAPVPDTDLGRAINDRLRRAAAPR